MPKQEIENYNDTLLPSDKIIAHLLANVITQNLANAENKIWHRHPVWFLEGNPIVGYSKLKDGLRLMFWSGADFGEELLKVNTGKFKDASILYTDVNQVNTQNLKRWLEKSILIQWDYKNIVKRKGRLEKLSDF